ncbi:MAG: hypothetical protein AABX33_03975 [Nanoarchaeota archaeon]
MTRKIISMFIIYLVLASFISIQINAEPPTKTSEFPDNTKPEEQEKWILNNPNLFDSNNLNQKDAFLRAYNKGKVELPTHIETVSNYVSTFSNGIPTAKDREIANKYVSYVIKKNADFNEGDIRITIDTKTQASHIITSDGIKHSVSELSKINNLIGIRSRADGLLELITNDKGVIILIGTTLNMNKNNEVVLSNGQTIKFEENKYTTRIEVNEFGSTVTCEKKCILSKGYAIFELNDNGKFLNHGKNRFSVIDGTARLGQSYLSGAFSFSLKIGKDSHTEFDLSRIIELIKFGKSGNYLKNSFMHLEDPQVNDGKLHFGNVDIATGSGGATVAACFDCKDTKNFDFYSGGYVNFKPFKNNNCNSASCETVYKAEIKGLVAARFEKDAFHEGFDRNLVVSYYPNGKNSKDVGTGILTLDSCNECEIGEGHIVGVQTLNNNFFRIENEPYSSEKQQPQLRNKLVGMASNLIPYVHLAKFNKEGINFYDKDVYYTLGTDVSIAAMGTFDAYNTGAYRSTILGGSPGKNTVEKYLREYYQDNSQGPNSKAIGILNELKNTKYERDIYVVDNTAFKYDKNGNKVNVQNLYITTKDNKVIIDQIGVVESGKYADFFQRQSTKEIVDILDKKGLTGKERQEEFERLRQLKNDEIFFKTRLQSFSAMIDKGREISESYSWPFGVIKNLISARPLTDAQIEEARKYIVDYKLKYDGSKKIFEMQSNGLALEDVYKNSDSSPEIKAAFQEPFLVHKLNQEIIEKAKFQSQDAEIRSDTWINIYYLENGELKSKPVELRNANRISALGTSRAYVKDTSTYSSDTRLAFDIYSQQIASELSSKESKEAFEKYKQNLISNSKADGVQYNRYKEGSIFAYSNEKDFAADGVKPSNYIKLSDGKYFVASPEVIKQIKDGKINPSDLIELSQINQKYQQDERAKQLKLIADALIPSNYVEAGVNLATGYGPLVKGALGVYKARTVMKAALAAAELTGNVALTGLVGVARSPYEEQRLLRQMMKQSSNRKPSSVSFDLSTGTTYEWKLAPPKEDRIALSRSRQVDAEVPFGILGEHSHEGRTVTFTETSYDVPKRKDIAVFKEDTSRAEEIPQNTILKALREVKYESENIMKELHNVDTQRSFGITKEIEDMTEVERRAVLTQVINADEFRLPSQTGDAGPNRVIWMKDSGTDSKNMRNQFDLEIRVTKLKEAQRSLLESDALLKQLRIDKITLDPELVNEGAVTPELILDLARRDVQSTRSSTVSGIFSSSVVDGHVHPANRFNTGSATLNKLLTEAVGENAFEFRMTDKEKLKRAIEVAPYELRISAKVNADDMVVSSRRLLDIFTAEDPKKAYVKIRADQAKEALSTGDNIYIAETERVISSDDVLWNVDPITGENIASNPRRRLELFIENQDIIPRNYIDPQALTNLQVDLVLDYISANRRVEKSRELLKKIEEGATFEELFFSAIDPGVYLPSTMPGDLSVLLLNPQKLEGLPTGEQIRKSKLLYPAGVSYGQTLVLYEEKTGLLHIKFVVGDKVINEGTVPLGEFLRKRTTVVGDKISKEEQLFAKLEQLQAEQSKKIKVSHEVGLRLDREGLTQYSPNVQEVLKFSQTNDLPIDEIVSMSKITEGMTSSQTKEVIKALKDGTIEPHDIDLLKGFTDFERIVRSLNNGEVSLTTVKSLAQVQNIKEFNPESLSSLARYYEKTGDTRAVEKVVDVAGGRSFVEVEELITSLEKGVITLSDIDLLKDFKDLYLPVSFLRKGYITIDGIKLVAQIENVKEIESVTLVSLAEYLDKTRDVQSATKILDIIKPLDYSAQADLVRNLEEGRIDLTQLASIVEKLKEFPLNKQRDMVLSLIREFRKDR